MAASQVNQNMGVLCDDLCPDDRLQFEPVGLNLGGSDSIPSFRSFIDNLPPAYWGSIWGECDSIPFFPSLVDSVAPQYWALPSDRELELIFPDVRDSSGLKVDDPISENMSEKLSVTHKTLISSPDNAPSTSEAHSLSSSSKTKLVTCPPGADGDGGREHTGIQFQYTPGTSAGVSSIAHYPALHESRIPSSRVVQGEQVELWEEDKENDTAAGFGSQRNNPLPLQVELEAPAITDMQSEDVLGGELGSEDKPKCQHGEFLEGGCDCIPFFPSFLDNLGPRYRPELSQPQVSKLGDTMVTPDNVALHTPDSSRIGTLQDLVLDKSEHDEITSIPKPLTTCSETAAGHGLINDPFTVRGNGVTSCTPPTEVDACGENIFQYQWTPVSSMASTTSIPHTTIFQLQEPSSRNFKSSTKKDLSEDNWDRPSSSRLRSKRALQGMGSVSQVLELATPQPHRVSKISSYASDDFEDIMVAVYAAKSKKAKRRDLTRMRISPYVSFSRSKMLKTFNQWHSRLGLENPACSKLAANIFFPGYREFRRSTWPPQMLKTNDCRLKLLMATSFWIAAKILETNRKVPTAERVSCMANIKVESLINFELLLLDALRWQLVLPC